MNTNCNETILAKPGWGQVEIVHIVLYINRGALTHMRAGTRTLYRTRRCAVCLSHCINATAPPFRVVTFRQMLQCLQHLSIRNT